MSKVVPQLYFRSMLWVSGRHHVNLLQWELELTANSIIYRTWVFSHIYNLYGRLRRSCFGSEDIGTSQALSFFEFLPHSLTLANCGSDIKRFSCYSLRTWLKVYGSGVSISNCQIERKNYAPRGPHHPLPALLASWSIGIVRFSLIPTDGDTVPWRLLSNNLVQCFQETRNQRYCLLSDPSIRLYPS